jgi:hypothetical protein
MYDQLSGDADSTDHEDRSFDTVYGTNHKYYGIADVFTNIPLHTGGHGLRDAAVKLNWKPTAHVTSNLDVHRFASATKTARGSGFGYEIDAFGSYQHSASLQLSGGVAEFFPGDAFAAIGRPKKDAFFSYAMLTVTL